MEGDGTGFKAYMATTQTLILIAVGIILVLGIRAAMKYGLV